MVFADHPDTSENIERRLLVECLTCSLLIKDTMEVLLAALSASIAKQILGHVLCSNNPQGSWQCGKRGMFIALGSYVSQQLSCSAAPVSCRAALRGIDMSVECP